ncbi:hypothetical protein Rs2_32346 [Raphanus sativus]|nr:hypothetical protein Rs2_32346 [Raphanus sativus]
MSKLPGYLQAEESLQSSGVLNVGVLDWSRLEKWKHGRSTSRASPPHHHHHHHVHTCSNLGKKVRASRDLGCTLEPELLLSRASSSSLNKQELPTCCSYKSSARDHERVKSRRSSPSSSALLSTMGNSRGSRRSFMVRDKETDEKRAGEAQEEDRRKHCVDGEDKTVVGGCSNACEKHQQVSNLRSTKQSRSTLLSSEQPPHMPCRNSKVAREVNRSLHLETDSSDDMMLPLLLGVDQEKKTDPSSPSKRFSFSFGRLSTSFTFKEEDSSAGQPLTSSYDTIKSDSMTFDGLACPSQSSNPEEEKQNLQCGSRVSPLRRLLHPLLKSKGSENVLLPSKPTSTSSNQYEMKKKPDASRTRALLQLTTRNGIPLFQFVVDDDDNLNKNKSKSKSKSRSILGATMKSFKEDSVQYCTFYSVTEVKKKKKIGSWLIHQEKQQQKQHRFVYNVIGEMRLEEQKSESMSSVMRESVLVDETEEGVKGRKEVAAVVIKKKKKMPGEEVYGETTTVIIPGGVHSIPKKGGPTPLIRRWRTGGCCDCGGWDVGCKLHVFSNKTFLHHLFDQTFQLFHQEESDKKCGGPVLEMTEVKRGIYRVEFGSFLSHLQAFFVCVTVITCASEEEETVSKKSSLPFAPPLSPVGRA